MVLTKVRARGNYTVVSVSAEGPSRLHLEQLGFVPGETIEVVSTMGGNVIVSVKGSRVALDSRLADSIMV